MSFSYSTVSTEIYPGYIPRSLHDSPPIVHQHAVTPQLHRPRRLRGGADPGSDEHRQARTLDDQPDRDAILDAEPRAVRRAQRHDRDRARILQPLRRDRIVDAIDHRLEAFVRQNLDRKSVV